jgi:RNA polymerase sigma-32 factor
MRTGVDRDVGLARYLVEIERYPVLGREEELDLCRRARAGDREAADRVVTSSLRYVARIASHYGGHGMRAADLIAEGNLGLLQAIRRFEPARGLRFMTYAGYWVRAFVLGHILRQWSLVGAGTGPQQSRMFFRLQRERSRLEARIGDRAEVTRRLARKFETGVDDVLAMERRLAAGDASLDSPIHADGGTGLDFIVSAQPTQDEQLERSERRAQVRARLLGALAGMDARENLIVRSRLLREDPATLADIGRKLGVSRERVRQLEERVKEKLRAALGGAGDRAAA